MTPAEIAWLAGLFEGEGCLSGALDTRRDKVHFRWQLTITMTDPDIVRRCHELTDVGYFVDLGVRQQEGRKQAWRWSVTKYIDIRDVALAIRPWLGQRRTAKIDEFLAGPVPVRLHKNLQKVACPQNHVYDSENTQIRSDGGRVCAECNRQRARRHQQRYASLEVTS